MLILCLILFFRAAQQAAAALAAQTGAGTRKGPPPLLRSRTLPAIIVPGISILNAQLDPSRLTPSNYRLINSPAIPTHTHTHTRCYHLNLLRELFPCAHKVRRHRRVKHIKTKGCGVAAVKFI